MNKLLNNPVLSNDIFLSIMQFLDINCISKIRGVTRKLKYFVDIEYPKWGKTRNPSELIVNENVYALVAYRNHVDFVYNEACCHQKMTVLKYIYLHGWIPSCPEYLYVSTCLTGFGRISVLRWIKIRYKLNRTKLLFHLVQSSYTWDGLQKLFKHPYTKRFYSNDIITYLVTEKAARNSDIVLLEWLKDNSILHSFAATIGALYIQNIDDRQNIIERFGIREMEQFANVANMLNFSENLNDTLNVCVAMINELRNSFYIAHLLWQFARSIDPIKVNILNACYVAVQYRITKMQLKAMVVALRIENLEYSAQVIEKKIITHPVQGDDIP